MNESDMANEPLVVLASSPVPEAETTAIEDLVRSRNGRWLASPEERDARIAMIEQHIHEATVFFGGRLSDEQFARAERLRWIHVPWAGVNTILGTRGIRERDVIITNSSGVMSDSVADHVLGVTVMVLRDLPAQVLAQERREWINYPTESRRRQLLRGKTMGILGLGTIGHAVARRAAAFGMNVTGTRRNAGATDDSNAMEDAIATVFPSEKTLDVLASSDIVVVALPLTPETRGSIGREAFRAMKRSAWFVNIARGAVVVEEDLLDALRTGEVAGAALDVFTKEPLPPDSPFWTMPNVLVTPHSSGAFQGYREAAAALFLENLRRYLEGRELLNVVRDGY